MLHLPTGACQARPIPFLTRFQLYTRECKVCLIFGGVKQHWRAKVSRVRRMLRICARYRPVKWRQNSDSLACLAI